MDIKQISEYIEACLKEKGVEKAVWRLSESETREFNAEQDGFKLYRTLFGGEAAINVFLGGKKGSVKGTDLSEQAISKMISEAVASAEVAPEDPANDIAPYAGEHVFREGDYEPDEEGLFNRTRELLDELKNNHPLVAVTAIITQHTKEHSLYRNTNGTAAESFSGLYSADIEISGNDGEKTTGLDFTGVKCADLTRPFIECGSILSCVKNAEAQLNTVALGGKFTGTVVFTPACLTEMLGHLISGFLSERPLLDGSGLWNNRTGEQVADEKLSFGMLHSDKRLVGGKPVTAEGYLTKDLPLIENGILKNMQLSLYTANKTGRSPSENDGFELVVKNGDTPLADIIAGIEHGLLAGGFSGGQPGANGEFSGVAKNSYLIENGRIVGAVIETMISGNLADIFNNIAAVSREESCTGYYAAPYMAVNGVVISGK